MSAVQKPGLPALRPDMKINASTLTFVPTTSSRNRTFGSPVPSSSWTSIKNMPAEVATYAIDPAIWINSKDSETTRHDLDEKLDAFQRALICVNGNLSEKIWAANEVSNLVKLNADKAFAEVIPLIEAELKKSADPELHNAMSTSLSKAFKDMMRARNPQRIKHILEFVNAMLNSTDVELLGTWLETMEAIIDLMSPKDSVHQILPLIQERVKSGKKPESKKAACVLIRKLVKHDHDNTATLRAVSPLLQGLAKDSDATVRVAVCILLPDLMAKADPTTMQEFQSVLLTFSNDTNPSVKASLVHAIGRLFSTVKKEVLAVDVLLGIVKKVVKLGHCQDVPNIPLLVTYSKYMAHIAKTANEKNQLTAEDKLWLLDSFLYLSRYDLPVSAFGSGGKEIPPGFVNFRNKVEMNRKALETLLSTPCTQEQITKEVTPGANNNDIPIEKWMCRAHAASDFKDFVAFAKPLVDFKGGLHNIMIDLVHDPHPAVRKNMAAGVFLVMEQVGDQAGILKDAIVRILSDDNVDVIEAIVPNLANIMKILVKTQVVSPDSATAALTEIGGVILFCEERLSQTRDWRVHSSLLLQMVVLPFCIPCDYIYTNFVPILLHRLLHLNQLPSRLGAAEALVSFLRHCRRASQRDDIRRKIRGFAQSKSAQDRILYLYMSNMIMDRFSRKYFRDHFFDTTLGLTDDKIPNVRTKAYHLMPKLKDRTRNAEDTKLLKKLEAIVQKIQSSETDKDAVEAMKAAVAEMAKIESYLKSDPASKQKSDKEDQKKETEEVFIASLEARMTSGGKISPGHDLYNRIEVNKQTVHAVSPLPNQKVPAVVPNKEGIKTENPSILSPASGPNIVPLAAPRFPLPAQGRNIVPLAKKRQEDSNTSRTTASSKK